LRVLHISDLHLNPTAYDIVESVVEQFGVDVVVDTGDSTDLGTTAELPYVDAIGRLDVPYVGRQFDLPLTTCHTMRALRSAYGTHGQRPGRPACRCSSSSW
jgi:3',5'-cyclic AMP phosphodiesterase CpdA